MGTCRWIAIFISSCGRQVRRSPTRISGGPGSLAPDDPGSLAPGGPGSLAPYDPRSLAPGNPGLLAASQAGLCRALRLTRVENTARANKMLVVIAVIHITDHDAGDGSMDKFIIA